MKNCDMSLEDHPLEDLILEVLNAASSIKVECFMVGATARDIVLEQWGISPDRATRDVDFGVRVVTWEEFNLLCNVLTQRGFEKTNSPHRFLWNELPVDIIPFGELEEPKSRLDWGDDIVFTTIGFEEALKCSHVVQIKGKNLKIASLAGLFLLKLIAWNDRPQERGSDAVDMAKIMQCYLDVGNEERMYEVHNDLIELLEPYDVRRASAALLGRDLKKFVVKNLNELS